MFECDLQEDCDFYLKRCFVVVAVPTVCVNMLVYVRVWGVLRTGMCESV